jgi:glucose-1-phosphate adenylyltransferase
MCAKLLHPEIAQPAVVSSSMRHGLQDFSQTLPGVEKTVLSIILGGGAGTRLYPLTKKRAKPAVPLGGNYRLIDIPVSNCLNSNINKIYCLTQVLLFRLSPVRSIAILVPS